jgi:hypothetical protein
MKKVRSPLKTKAVANTAKCYHWGQIINEIHFATFSEYLQWYACDIYSILFDEDRSSFMDEDDYQIQRYEKSVR